MCDRAEQAGGVCQTMFEKHRGDETPYTRRGAHDTIFSDASPGVALPAGAEPIAYHPHEDIPQELATTARNEKTTGLDVSAHTANL